MSKIIILDIDGTLLNSQKVITQKTREALIHAQENGNRLILASGRPTSAMNQLADQLEMTKHHGILVSYNGSRVVDCQSGKVLFNKPLSVEEGKAVLEHLKQFDVIPMLEGGEYFYVNDVYHNEIIWNGNKINIIEYESRGGGYLLCEKKDLANYLDYEVNKILVAGQPEYLLEHSEQIAEPFKESLNCMFTAAFYFEFTAKGIDKAKALETVFSLEDIHSQDVIAFGDGHNDISMLKMANISVAMGNAVEEVKQAADIVTLSNDEDGIAHALADILK